MRNTSNSPNFIIILGTTKSGSGAVFDYLIGRGDIRDPLKGQEYHLPQMPYGLMTLEAVANNAFHPGNSDFVISQFEKIIKKISRSQTKWHYGMGYSNRVPFFQKSVDQFIEEICSAKFPMRLHWRKLVQSETVIKYLIYKLKNRLGFFEKAPFTRLLVSQDKLIDAAQKLHDRLFQEDSDSRPILLNQAGSGWNAVESTKYFFNRKVVLLTRDPRDQFAELKIIKNARSVDDFIDWYKEMQRRIKEINNPILLQLRFEDFVIENDKMVNLLCKHLSVDSSVVSDYNPSLSKINIGKYHKILNKTEIDKIHNSLSEYFYDR